MKLKHTTLIVLITILSIHLKGYSQEETIATTEQTEVVENHSLYNTDWKLVKMEPEFSDKIDLVLSFDKTTEQLKVIKQITSAPVLRGTDLITSKNKSINFHHWKYIIKSAEYEGDNIKSVTYDYTVFELKTEGYIFKIDNINETTLVLEVIKAPIAVFGNSIFNVKKIYFTK